MYRRKVTAATLRRHKLERRGEGSGDSYVPGVQVRRSDNPSHGRSSVENNFKLGRQQDLLTKFQSAVCLTLRRTDAVKDILENHPFPLHQAEHPGQRWSTDTLAPTEGSVAIASARHLRHPRHPDADDEPKNLITPLVIALQPNEDAPPVAVAMLLSHRSSTIGKRPARQGHQLLTACWEAADVEVLTCHRSSLPEVVYQNHIWLCAAERFNLEIISNEKIVESFIACTQRADWNSQSAHSVLTRIAAQLRIPLAASFALYKHCLWSNRLSTDLTRPLWRLVIPHGHPTVGSQPLAVWHPLSRSRWLK